jgi:hypothetical protein
MIRAMAHRLIYKLFVLLYLEINHVVQMRIGMTT